jgi:transposase InsO family protein
VGGSLEEGLWSLIVAAFIKENIICRFGIPDRLVSDNGTPFKKKEVAALCEKYGIKQDFSTAHNPQANGQAEAINKQRDMERND